MTQVPFGFKNGRMVDVHEVEKGLACGCLCPKCDSQLIARKGTCYVHHFAHYKHTLCENAYESSIHKMAKQILVEEGCLQLPGLTIEVQKKDQYGFMCSESERVCEPKWVYLDDVKQEVAFGSIRVDIVGYKGQHPLIIEIVVTHAADKNKKRYIRDHRWSAIEIKLTDLGYLANREELKNHLLTSVANKYWLSHPRAPKIKQSLKQKIQKEIEKLVSSPGNVSGKRSRITTTLLHRAPKHVKTKPKHVVSPNQYENRYFVCDECAHSFVFKQKDLDALDGKLCCPKCNKEVDQRAP